MARRTTHLGTHRNGSDRVDVWGNPDSQLLMTIIEADGSATTSDITSVMPMLVATGFAARTEHLPDATSDANTVELGSLEIAGTFRVALNGRRLTEDAVLVLVAEGLTEVVRVAARLYEPLETPEV